jgi:hypothetical protein
MTKTTKLQRQALWRVYMRLQQTDSYSANPNPLGYRQFRKTVQPTFGCDGAVTVPYASMWLCIERDGYTHS